MSAQFINKLLENLSLEDFAIIKLMEEIQEINQEIEMKKSAVHNRMDLLRRILQKSENAETRVAIESFLLKIEHENKYAILMDNNRENSEEVKEQEPSEKSKVEEEPSTSEQTNDQ